MFLLLCKKNNKSIINYKKKKNPHCTCCATPVCCFYISVFRHVNSLSKCIQGDFWLFIHHVHALLSHFTTYCTCTERRWHLRKKKCSELTRVHLPVSAHSVGVHNILEAWGELVGPYQRRWRVVSGDTIDKGRNCCSALPLKYQCQTVSTSSYFDTMSANIWARQKVLNMRRRQRNVHFLVLQSRHGVILK